MQALIMHPTPRLTPQCCTLPRSFAGLSVQVPLQMQKDMYIDYNE